MTIRRVTLTAASGLAALCAGLEMARGDITGSGHDFSAYTWSESEICLPCHTPHNADTSVDAPLWNHRLTSATYQLYTSPTLLGTVEEPGEESLLCLSCHDGTIALDSFGGNMGITYVTGDALIGTNLQDDHPIGIEWSHQNPDVNCANCHDPYAPPGENFVSRLPFFDERIECQTCHEPHNEDNLENMLRVTKNASMICLYCHNP